MFGIGQALGIAPRKRLHQVPRFLQAAAFLLVLADPAHAQFDAAAGAQATLVLLESITLSAGATAQVPVNVADGTICPGGAAIAELTVLRPSLRVNISWLRCDGDPESVLHRGTLVGDDFRRGVRGFCADGACQSVSLPAHTQLVMRESTLALQLAPQ